MSGKFMKVKRFILPTLTMVIIASQLMGCAATNDNELLKMLQQGQQIEIEVAAPIYEEQGEQQSLDWIQLDQLNTYADFRAQLDDLMKITRFGDNSKNGIAYIDLSGQHEGNNTLYNALMNRKFIANFLENDSVNLELEQSINSLYTDADESEAMVAAINAYWNLLPDATPNYFNGSGTISRIEAMTLLARANTPVTENIGDTAFEAQVGNAEYANFASLVASDSYLDVESKSLDEKTATGTITRGEYIYMLVSNIFGADRLSSADIKKAQFNDAKDGGDIATAQEFTGHDMFRSYELKYAMDNPDDGCPTRMYQGLAAAQELGVIGSETRWDEGLTKSEAIQLYIDMVQAYAKANGYAVDQTSGSGAEDVEVVEQQKPVEESDSNVGGMDFGRDEKEVEAEIAEEEDTVEVAEYEIIPMEDTTFYALQAANLRGGPGTQYDKVGSLSYAQEIVCNGKVEDGDKLWLVLKTDDGSTQMVSGSLVSRDKPVQQSKPSGNTGTGGGGGSQQPSSGTGQPSGGNSGSGGGSSQPSGGDGGGFDAGSLGLPEMGSGGLGDTDIHWEVE